jgi:hypothetical protein
MGHGIMGKAIWEVLSCELPCGESLKFESEHNHSKGLHTAFTTRLQLRYCNAVLLQITGADQNRQPANWHADPNSLLATRDIQVTCEGCAKDVFSCQYYS